MAVARRTGARSRASSRFELAPPRRFILPAVLLALSEQPGYGYGLVPGLEELGLGRVDRPAVYRALAQLEADGLVEATPAGSTAGQGRRVYAITVRGEQVLGAWMGVVREERDCLSQVLHRYRSRGDSLAAGLAARWSGLLGAGLLGADLSPAGPGPAGLRRLVAVDPLDEPAGLDPGAGWPTEGEPEATAAGARRRRFRLVPGRSAVLVEGRSSVGPLSFGVIGVTGWVDAAVCGGALRTDVVPEARLEVDVTGLRSGNRFYDAEFLRRIDARRFPTATVALTSCRRSGPGARYRLGGELTFHGVSRATEGTVAVSVGAGDRLVVSGEQAFDIRDFELSSPTMLMLRIFPDVRVLLHAEAEPGPAGG